MSGGGELAVSFDNLWQIGWGQGHMLVLKAGQGREFSFALRTSLPSTICSLYLLHAVVQWGPDVANWSLLSTCLSLKLLQVYWEEFADLHNSHPQRLQCKQSHHPGSALDAVSICIVQKL